MKTITLTIDGIEKKLAPIDVHSSYGDLLFKNVWYREVEAEKDYEIVSFRSTVSIDTLIWELTEESLYRSEGMLSKGHSLDRMLHCVKDGTAVIQSVRRLSDNEVFAVGGNYGKGEIAKFEIVHNTMWYRTVCDILFPLNHAVKVTSPTIILKTEDGKEITDGEQIVFYCTPLFTCGELMAEEVSGESKYFSTEEARDEYILQNKPIRTTLKEWMDYDSDMVTFFKSKQNSND